MEPPRKIESAIKVGNTSRKSFRELQIHGELAPVDINAGSA
jgi:hypothetical protein